MIPQGGGIRHTVIETGATIFCLEKYLRDTSEAEVAEVVNIGRERRVEQRVKIGLFVILFLEIAKHHGGVAAAAAAATAAPDVAADPP